MKLSPRAIAAAFAVALSCSTIAAAQAQNPYTNFVDAYNASYSSANAARAARLQAERHFNAQQQAQVQRQIMQQEMARRQSQSTILGATAQLLPNLYDADSSRAANAAQNARMENELQTARSQALAEQMQRQLTSILAVTCARNGGMVINGKCI